MGTLKSRHERAFNAFSNDGEFITFESYTGQAARLADIRGDDPSSPSIVSLTEELESMWTEFTAVADTNKDGRVDREEWMPFAEGASSALAGVGLHVEWPLEPYIRKLFDAIDADADGRITPTEDADWLASMGLAHDTDIAGALPAST